MGAGGCLLGGEGGKLSVVASPLWGRRDSERELRVLRTETGMAAGSKQGKGWGEAGDVHLLWEGSSIEQPHVASVLQLRGAPGLEPGAGSLLLFRGSCAFTQGA